jgi:hypothetical protein
LAFFKSLKIQISHDLSQEKNPFVLLKSQIFISATLFLTGFLYTGNTFLSKFTKCLFPNVSSYINDTAVRSISDIADLQMINLTIDGQYSINSTTGSRQEVGFAAVQNLQIL